MLDLSVPVTYPFLSHFGELPDPTGCNQNRIELPPLETTKVELRGSEIQYLKNVKIP